MLCVCVCMLCVCVLVCVCVCVCVCVPVNMAVFNPVQKPQTQARILKKLKVLSNMTSHS
jgi:hypothetical protein